MALDKPFRLLVFSFIPLLAISSPALSDHASHPDPMENVTCQSSVFYSPHGGATTALIRQLEKAERTIRVAIYGLTHSDLINALVAAKGRGIEVVVKVDKVQSAGQAQKTALAELKKAGIPVEVSAQSRQLHHKFAVIDGRWVITGSFNWTRNAEKSNRENLVIFDCPDLASSFSAEWELIRHDGP